MGEWGSIFGNDPIIATAILDCLLHHSTTINIRGESYRLRERKKAGLLPQTSQGTDPSPVDVLTAWRPDGQEVISNACGAGEFSTGTTRKFKPVLTERSRRMRAVLLARGLMVGVGWV